MDWNEAAIDRLKALVGEGLSATEIAKKFGHGLTREAISGKAWRMGLTIGDGRRGRKARGHTPRPQLAHKFDFRRRPVEKPAPSPKQKGTSTARAGRLAPPEPLRVTLEGLRPRQCRYPYGDAVPYAFCGHPAEEDAPYCPAHMRFTHTGKPERRP